MDPDAFWRQPIGFVTLLGIAAALFVGGYQVGANSGIEARELLKQQKEAQAEECDRLRQELDFTKLLIPKQALTIDHRPFGPGATSAEGTGKDSTLPAGSSGAPSTEDALEVSLSPGTSAPLFDGALLLSLKGLDFAVSPSRYQAHFTVSAGGSQLREFKEADTGYKAEYERFQITLLGTGPTSARFLVRRLP